MIQHSRHEVLRPTPRVSANNFNKIRHSKDPDLNHRLAGLKRGARFSLFIIALKVMIWWCRILERLLVGKHRRGSPPGPTLHPYKNVTLENNSSEAPSARHTSKDKLKKSKQCSKLYRMFGYLRDQCCLQRTKLLWEMPDRHIFGSKAIIFAQHKKKTWP